MAKELKPGSLVRAKTEEGEFKGIVMERSSLVKPTHIVLKLDSGYNVGIEKEKIQEVEHLAGQVEKEETPIPSKPIKSNLPNVSVLATGGTIASRVDYVTGGVVSVTSAEELVSAVPELSDIATLSCRQIFNKFSENLAPSDWVDMAKIVYEELRAGKQGAVITHGTDTMGYSAAAISFLLRSPSPVVLTGAQRSSDRGSSDAALNLIAATLFAAEADYSGVVIAMHSQTDDSSIAIHPGTRVKKLHSSRRDAFKAVGVTPIAEIQGREIKFLRGDWSRRGGGLKFDDKLEGKVILLKYTPGLNSQIIPDVVKLGYKGIVLEGTGLGHVSESFFKPLKEAISSGVTVVMTSQTVWGRVNMNVYSTGRGLQDIGVIQGEDMLSETAYVKLMWVLAKEKKPEKIKELMLTNIAGEITERTLIEQEDS